MADLNIPNLNKRNDKYLFKDKLPLKRKSKRRLINESFFMIIFSIIFATVSYLIPNKVILFQNLVGNVRKSFSLMLDLSFSLFQIFLVVFVIVSILFSLILLIGSLYRLRRVISRKSKNIKY